MKLQPHTWRFLCLSLGLLCGCASITERRRHQYVYIQSEPPGAAIYDEGKVIGTTPELVRLRRHRTYTLELQRGRERRPLTLQSNYALKESLGGNLWLLSLAPVGWLTDLLTGAAWNYQDPPPEIFAKSNDRPTKPLRIALAPPFAGSFSLSDEAARYWEGRFKELYPKATLIPYQNSIETFQEAGFDFDLPTEDLQRLRQALYELRANQVFLSEVQLSRQGAQFKGELKDATGAVIDQRTDSAPVTNSSSWADSTFKLIPQWFQFIPNTVGIELANTRMTLSEYGAPGYSIIHYGQETGNNSALDQGLSYLQAFTLSHLTLPRIERSGQWKFQFVPAARLSKKTVFFPDFDKLANVNFTYLEFGAGLGPEMGYQSGKHYSYFKGIMLWTYSQIQWQQPEGGSETMALGALIPQFEFGYIYFFTERMNFRTFSRGTASPKNLWTSVTQRVNPTTAELQGSQENYAGMAFGYTFDFHNNVLFKNKK